MKRLFLLLAVILFASCGSAPTTTSALNTDDGLHVLYFHGKQRCITCMAIEKLSQEVIKADFAEELKNGDITYTIIDITTPEGAEIANRYEVSFSSLFANSWKDGVETKGDLTKMGFSYAKSQPEIFKTEFKNKINELLKK